MCSASAHLPAVLAAVTVLAAAAAAETTTERAATLEAMAISQAALGNAVRDLELRDSHGSRRQLREFFGRPVAISLIYTACAHSCSVTTRHVGRVVQMARHALGADSFTMLTVGFDPAGDDPEAMRQFARRHGISDPNWIFLSAGEPDGLDRLVADLGFVYTASPRGFDHTVQISLLDSSGHVYRQIYGETFEAPLLVEPLKELVLGRPSADAGLLERISDRVRLFCTVYDARGDRYVFDYSLFMGIVAGVLVLGLAIAWLTREILRKRSWYGA